MNVLIIGAGASCATHDLPSAITALAKWKEDIRRNRPLLALALKTWAGSDWPNNKDLETAWTQIDRIWKRRAGQPGPLSTPDLPSQDRQEVRRLAREAADNEPAGAISYYRTQIRALEELGHSEEQYLSTVAGWELRKLIQETFVRQIEPDRCHPYHRLLQDLQPAAIISFNYDTLIEQCLSPGWTYEEGSDGSHNTTIVLKPHGSITWKWRLNLQDEESDEFDFATPVPPDEMGYQGGWLVQNLVIGLREKIEHTPKETRLKVHQCFSSILGRCEQVLTAAERVWIVGYRFAEADETFQKVLTRARARRKYPPSLAVINRGENPNELLPRLQELFGSPSSSPAYCFYGFEHWANHGFCHP